MKKELGHIEAADNGKYVVACLICGEKKPVMLYPHKKDGNIVGWVFLCADDEKEAQGMRVIWQKDLPVVKLSDTSPNA